MKKILCFILPLLFVMSSCNDYFSDDSEVNELKSAKKEKYVTIKIHARLSSTVNYAVPMISCVPEIAEVAVAGAGWIDGHSSLLGNVNQEESTYIITNCEFDPSTMTVSAFGTSQMVGANGDMYYLDVVEFIDLTTMNFTGYVDLTGGTGKFKDATGHVEMINGLVNDDGSGSWEGYGEIILKK